MSESTESAAATASDFGARFSSLRAEVGKVIVGQEQVLDKVLLGFLCGGHVLLEGVPGLAKTLLIETLSRCIQADFSRINSRLICCRAT